MTEPYLPPLAPDPSTWQQLYLDQRYETSKWEDATRSIYEQCQPTPGPTLLNRYPRPGDGYYCYYWSLFQHNRAIAWMIVNAGLALHTLDCAWVNGQAGGRWLPANLSCEALQHDFGPFLFEGVYQ